MRILRAGSSSEASVLDALPKRYIVYFGRLSSEKGLLTLLDAVGRVMRAPLVICGDGPLRKRARGARARDKRHACSSRGISDKRFSAPWSGGRRRSFSRPRVPRMRRTRCSSRWPLGVPVIVSSMGGLPELAGRGGGVVFTAGDAAELAARIYEFWEDASLAGEVGELRKARGGRTAHRETAHR